MTARCPCGRDTPEKCLRNDCPLKIAREKKEPKPVTLVDHWQAPTVIKDFDLGRRRLV